MAKILTLSEAQNLPPGQLKDWAYNALDTTGTREVADTLLPLLVPSTQHIYNFERALQNPAFSMMMKGVRIDTIKRAELVGQLKKELAREIKAISTMKGIVDVWDGRTLETGWCPEELGKRHKWPKGVPDEDRKCERCHTPRIVSKPFEPNSTAQVFHLIYDLHKIPKMKNKKGEYSVDDDVLERLGHKYSSIQHITEAIRDVRDKTKQLGSLNAKLTPNNRYHSSFNVGAAWTGRFSSSKNPYMMGGNLQNWAERHRITLIPDEGMELAYLDLKQAESNVVAHVSQDIAYIEAHRIGDVHTFVARLVWPELKWTGDLKQDKKIAKVNPQWDLAPGHDFRFQAKRIQHGSNFGLTPQGISMIAHIPLIEAKKAQANYFMAFPKIRVWQEQQAIKIRNHEHLTNRLGRTILLFGRPWDPHTIKQGLAFDPQSSVADILDLAMLRMWWDMDPMQIELLAQVHDALLLQFQRGRLDILKQAISYMQIPIPVHGRTMIIQPEIAVGMNWGKRSEDNPIGIEEIEL